MSVAPDTCLGQAVTIIGTPGADLVGTDGADVVVTNGAGTVRTLGGDDLVCITADTRTVDAGPGNDTVDAGEQPARDTTTLGAGDDTYTGGDGFDFVLTEPLGIEGPDDGVDRVDTGPGGAVVSSGSEGLPNPDVIVMGTADEGANKVFWRGRQAGADAAILFGSGRAVLYISDVYDPRRWIIDGRRGRVTVGASSVVGWSGSVNRFAVDVYEPHEVQDVVFRGSDADESLHIRGPVLLDARMAGGDDTAYLGCGSTQPGSSVELGGGWDALLVNLFPCDRAKRVVRLDRHRLLPGVRGGGVEVLTVSARHFRVHGDDHDNVIQVGRGCEGVVHGGGGDDRLLPGDGRGCPRDAGSRLYGDRGDDELTGTSFDDLLVGGRGRDEAAGRGGTDRCLAEITSSCEIG